MSQTKLVIELRASALPASDLIAATVEGPTRCHMMRSGTHCPGLSIIPESPPNKFCLDLQDQGITCSSCHTQDTVPQEALQDESELSTNHASAQSGIISLHKGIIRILGGGNLEGKDGRWRKACRLVGVFLVSLAVMGAAIMLDHFSLSDIRTTQIRAILFAFSPFESAKQAPPAAPWRSWMRRRLF